MNIVWKGKNSKVTVKQLGRQHLNQAISVNIIPVVFTLKIQNPRHLWENITQTQNKGNSSKYLTSTVQKCQDHIEQGEMEKPSHTGGN